MTDWARLDLEVSKFTSFADLNGYCDALGKLPGVRDVKVRRLHRGVLLLSVDYEGIIPLADRLGEIKDHPPKRTSVDGDTIQVALTLEEEA